MRPLGGYGESFYMQPHWNGNQFGWMPGSWHQVPSAPDIVIIFCALFEFDWVVNAPICRPLRLRAATVGDYLGVLASEIRVQCAKDLHGLQATPQQYSEAAPKSFSPRPINHAITCQFPFVRSLLVSCEIFGILLLRMWLVECIILEPLHVGSCSSILVLLQTHGKLVFTT